jgi:hypothetical protein
MPIVLPLLLATMLSQSDFDPMRAQQWISLELGHASRSLLLADPIGDALNPNAQLSYHRNIFGYRALGAGVSLQTGVFSYDQLLIAPSVGTGLEGTLRLRSGLYAAIGVRFDYAHVFTGSNHFELAGRSYRQRTAAGRSFLRVTPVELSIGYSPDVLQRLGVVPALRFAWLIDLPLYANEDANPWSYTVLGVTLLWTWEKSR